jgi:hypothetical protein
MSKALKDELSDPQYIGTYEEKAQAYNAKTVQIVKRVSLAALQLYAADQGIVFNLRARESDVSDPAAQAAASKIMYMFSKDYRPEDVDVSDAAFQAGLTALVAAGDITSTQADEITGMGGSEQIHISAVNSALPKTISAQMVQDALEGGY